MPLYREEILNRFHLEFGRLVHAFSKLDYLVGIQLDWLGPHTGEDVSDVLLGRIPFAKRLDKLQPLIMLTHRSAGSEALAEFASWFEKVRSLKSVRNDYVHARWHVPDYFETEDPVVMMTPLNWAWDPMSQPASVPLAISALAEQAVEIETCSKRLDALLKKNLAFAAPAQGKTA